MFRIVLSFLVDYYVSKLYQYGLDVELSSCERHIHVLLCNNVAGFNELIGLSIRIY